MESQVYQFNLVGFVERIIFSGCISNFDMSMFILGDFVLFMKARSTMKGSLMEVLLYLSICNI